MAAQYQFVMRAGPTIGKIYPLEGPEITIGRESTNSISINDVEVSRKHARMDLRGTSYVIQDLGSTNGTFVNGQRVTIPQVLNPGDSVSFGEGSVLSYESAFDPNATMMSSNINRDLGAPAPAPVVPAPAPVPVPAPMPVEPPAPVYEPAYSGQVPPGPVPAALPAAPVKRNRTGLIIGIIIAVLILCCVCVALFAYFAPQSILCMPGIRSITDVVGPMFGYATCP